MAKIKRRLRNFAVKKTGNGKRKAALILSIIAIAILVANVIVYFTAKSMISAEVNKAVIEAQLPADVNPDVISSLFMNLLFTAVMVWLILAVLMIWTTYLLEKGKGKWYLLLICGILSFLTFRFDAGVLGIVASALYK
jgi:hypothetical protein